MGRTTLSPNGPAFFFLPLIFGAGIVVVLVIDTCGREQKKSCPLPAATAPVEFEEVDVPPLDRERTVTWFVQGSDDWAPPGTNPKETGCGTETTWGGGETISIPKGTWMQASFSHEEKEAMKKLGFSPTCLYWHHPMGDDLYVEPRQIDGTWVCWDKTQPNGGKRPEPVE